jgi:DNA-binding response OmpR family regulator
MQIGDKPLHAELSGPLRSHKILIIDEDYGSADMIRAAFSDLGFSVLLTENIGTALRDGVSFKPEVILLDAGSNLINAFGLCVRLRSAPEFREAILIAQTGWAEGNRLVKSIGGTVDHHLQKPIKIQDLIGILEKLHL